MNQTSFNLSAVLLLAATLSAVSCSSDKETPGPTCEVGECANDSATGTKDATTPMDSGTQPGPTSRLLEDASMLPKVDGGSIKKTEPLSVWIDVRGKDRFCGECAVVTAVIEDGYPAYDIVWSDDSLVGPGPHELCDATAKGYTVSVTDAGSNALDVESVAPVTIEAGVELPCDVATVDAGTEFRGCKLLFGATIIDALFSTVPDLESMYMCRARDEWNPDTGIEDGLVGSTKVYAKDVVATQQNFDAGSADDGPSVVASGFVLPGAMRAGKNYELAFDFLFGLQLGGQQSAEFWGSKDGCSKDQKLGEITMKGEIRNTVCLKPTEDYEHVLVFGKEGGVAPLFSLWAGISITACSGCQ